MFSGDCDHKTAHHFEQNWANTNLCDQVILLELCSNCFIISSILLKTMSSFMITITRKHHIYVLNFAEALFKLFSIYVVK